MKATHPARIATLAALPIAVLAGALVFWLMGGIPGHDPRVATGPVATTTRSLDDSSATACRALMARLPEEAGDRKRRPVTEGGEQNAAYGDPPIVLSCGTARPTIPQGAQTVTISGVCWWAEEQGDASVWTTVDRRVPLRAAVPAGVTGDWLVNLSPDIVAAIPTSEPTPGLC